MSSVIYKYPLQVADSQTVSMPKQRKIVKLGFDPAGRICVWAVVDPRGPTEHVQFSIRGTGQPFEWNTAQETYLDSIVQGSFVWHVFVEGRN